MTPITKETLEAAGWEYWGHSLFYHRDYPGRLDHFATGGTVIDKETWVFSIEQIAEMCTPATPSPNVP